MPISNYPKVLKYTIDDRPYTLTGYIDNHDFGDITVFNGNNRSDGNIQRVKVIGWRTEVTDSIGDGTGLAIQKDFYTVKNIAGYSSENSLNFYELYTLPEYEVPAHKLFSSLNHLLSVIKGKYLNSAFGNLHDDGYLYFSKMGNSSGNINTNGDWIDWAGMNFEDMDFTEVVYNSAWGGSSGYGYVGGELAGSKTLILDNCNLTNAIWVFTAKPITRAGLMASAFSFDKDTTIFTDGYPIGRPVTGTASGSSGGTTITGTGTKFLTELAVGGGISFFNVVGNFTITAIASDTSLTVQQTLPGSFSTRTISRVNGI